MNDIQFVVFSFKNLETSKIHAFFSFFYNENKKKHYIAIEKLTISIKPSRKEIEGLYSLISKYTQNQTQKTAHILSNSSIKQILDKHPTEFKYQNISVERNKIGCIHLLEKYDLQKDLDYFKKNNQFNLFLNISIHYETKNRKKQTYLKLSSFLNKEDSISNEKAFKIEKKGITHTKNDAQLVLFNFVKDHVNNLNISIKNLYINNKYNDMNQHFPIKKHIKLKHFESVNNLHFIQDKFKRPLILQEEILEMRQKMEYFLKEKSNPEKYTVVYTDGSCNDTNRYSSACLIESGDEKLEHCFTDDIKAGVKNNSNYCELVAIYSSLDLIIKNNLLDKPVSFIVDSDFISINLRWLKEKRYDLIDKKLKKSQLFRKIYTMINKNNINYVLTTIKSHTNNKMDLYLKNKIVDEMANKALKS